MAGTEHRIMVFSNPVAGHEDEYNEWYDDIHVSEVLQIDGFVACQRFVADAAGDPPAKYLAIYELDTEDPVAAWKTLQRTTSKMNMSNALDFSSVVAWIFTAHGDRVALS